MTRGSIRFGLTPREHRISALPSTIASIVVLAITMFNGSVLWPVSPLRTAVLLGAGITGIAYLAVLDLLVIPAASFRPSYSWFNSVVTSLGLLMITYAVPAALQAYVGVLLILSVITSSIIAERGPSYLMIILTTLGTSALERRSAELLQAWPLEVSIAVMAIVIVETVHQLRNQSRGHIRRLETIAEFSRHISSTLDKKQVMTLLGAAFQNAVEADSYFVGIREGDELRLELIYDDGEYFDNRRVKVEGSLSSWVLTNQQSLFLPDLRKEVELPGVRLVLVGKHKTSLSWLGVPMRGLSVDGIISIGSYRPNAFDRGDLELLTTLAQHAAQALDNTSHHEEVELQSQLDSLTSIYNHGSFLRRLQKQLDQAALQGKSLGLIMLDVDFFKQYNDSYGHILGDEVLITLTGAIKQHVKSTDTVGRWGGEEFVISLPDANATQARQVALRIRDTMASLTVRGPNGEVIPAPTVSQGVAIFPQEASSLVELIHLADKRLFVAKDRGRNQIEPDATAAGAGGGQQGN